MRDNRPLSDIMRELEAKRNLANKLDHASVLIAFELNRDLDKIDLETFLRSSNLPFAVEEYIRSQQTRATRD